VQHKGDNQPRDHTAPLRIQVYRPKESLEFRQRILQNHHCEAPSSPCALNPIRRRKDAKELRFWQYQLTAQLDKNAQLQNLRVGLV
jgi:hypothetical protein